MHIRGDSLNPSPSFTPPLASSQRAKGRMPNWLKRVLWGLLAIIIILPLAGILYQAIATADPAAPLPSRPAQRSRSHDELRARRKQERKWRKANRRK